MDENHFLVVSGPYNPKDKLNLAAYVVKGAFLNVKCTLCFLVLNNDLQRTRIEKNYASLFDVVMNYASQKYQSWYDIPLYVCNLQPGENGNAQLEIYPSSINEDNAERIAALVLEDMIIEKSETFNQQDFKITEFGNVAETDFFQYTIKNAGTVFSTSVMAKNPADLGLMVQLMDKLETFSVDSYREEVILYIEQQYPLEAFQSFVRYAQLINQDETIDIIEAINIGLEITKFLVARMFYDYADWTAEWATSLACIHKEHELALVGYRWLGIVNEALGRINASKAAYENGMLLFDYVSDLRKKAQFLMSFGISMIVLSSHLDFEELDEDACETIEQQILAPAQNYFTEALTMFDQLPDKNAAFARCSIQLDLARIDDLRGNYQHSLKRLGNLTNGDNDLNENPKLMISLIIYSLTALRNLSQKDLAWRKQYFLYLHQAAEILPNIFSAFPDKACLLSVLIGDALLILENPQDAAAYFSAAYERQQLLLQNVILSSGPGSQCGGIAAIDIAGKLQNALIVQHDSYENEALIWQALDTGERQKGCFFRRDLFFHSQAADHELSTYLKSKYRFLRKSLSQHNIDHRLLMADYQWFLKWDVDAGNRSVLENYDQSFEKPLDSKRIQSIFSQQKYRTAVVMFYATDRETFVYILKDPFETPIIIRLNISSSDLRKISESLHTGINGNEYTYSKQIIYNEPEKHKLFFAPFLALADILKPLIRHLDDVDLIYISPHGTWHSLPIHVLLLPLFWEKGRVPGLVYTPSTHLLEILNQRHFNNRRLQYNHYGLATVYSADESEKSYMKAHQTFLTLLQGTEVTIRDAFGIQVTRDKVMEDLNQVSLYHVLAHGCFLEGRQAMDSGLLLAEPSGLPDKKTSPKTTGTMIMLNGTSASHVSLQACSLGKRLADHGNEFWGFCRAVISAGANSVAAPLWDADLFSSTRFFELFYHNWLIDHQPKWKAWANAQHQLASGSESPLWSHFIHWAAFQLIGFGY
ncbi:CHAT domain-containing protein [Desulfosporosinus sp. OT]|uniref:CHAT domain-containing protein n=1 Tax=Desulfosporosinus sp. OT TaxID=913865 RepID=UPI000223A4A1|nr:CHAT domain-containing protein [Desulfosporosinus sp. OT]EGW37854.1 hypothetical protein DOT_4262 [Desulfosporosinus sp. OT]